MPSTATTPKDSATEQRFCFGQPSVIYSDPDEPEWTPRDTVSFGLHSIITSVGNLADVVQSVEALELPPDSIMGASLALLFANAALITYRKGDVDGAIEELRHADRFLKDVPTVHGPGACNGPCQSRYASAETDGSDA